MVINDIFERTAINASVLPNTSISNSFNEDRPEHTTAGVLSGTGAFDQAAPTLLVNDIFERIATEASVCVLSSLVDGIFERATPNTSVHKLGSSVNMFKHATTKPSPHPNTAISDSFVEDRPEDTIAGVPSGTGALDQATPYLLVNDIFERIDTEALVCALSSLVNGILNHATTKPSLHPNTAISDSFVEDRPEDTIAEVPSGTDTLDQAAPYLLVNDIFERIATEASVCALSSLVDDIFKHATTNTSVRTLGPPINNILERTTTNTSVRMSIKNVIERPATNTSVHTLGSSINIFKYAPTKARLHPNTAILDLSTEDRPEDTIAEVPSGTGALDQTTLGPLIDSIFECLLGLFVNDGFERTLRSLVNDVFEHTLSSFVDDIFERTPGYIPTNISSTTILNSFVNTTPSALPPKHQSALTAGTSFS